MKKSPSIKLAEALKKKEPHVESEKKKKKKMSKMSGAAAVPDASKNILSLQGRPSGTYVSQRWLCLQSGPEKKKENRIYLFLCFKDWVEFLTVESGSVC